MIYAVIPTGNRPSEYKAVYDWCIKQGVEPVTVATSPAAAEYGEGIVLHDNSLNISRWWNLGLDYAYRNKAEHIIVLNDDVTIPDDWLRHIVDALDSGYVGASGRRGDDKITGYAFGLNGQQRIRADEKLVWWYGDDDIQRQCEQAGGFICLPHLHVDNAYANSSYERMLQQIHLDRDYYHRKWNVTVE